MPCNTCKTTNTTCSCKDTPLTVPLSTTCPPNTQCPDPTPCYETILDTCVKHRGNYSIVNFGINAGTSGFTLTPGMSIEQVYQFWSVDTEAWISTCQPPYDVHPSYIGSTAIVISWGSTGAETYDIQISANQGVTWSTVASLTTTSYSFTLLNAASEYYFKVTSHCGEDSSTGAVISVTSLA